MRFASTWIQPILSRTIIKENRKSIGHLFWVACVRACVRVCACVTSLLSAGFWAETETALKGSTINMINRQGTTWKGPLTTYYRHQQLHTGWLTGFLLWSGPPVFSCSSSPVRTREAVRDNTLPHWKTSTSFMLLRQSLRYSSNKWAEVWVML